MAPHGMDTPKREGTRRTNAIANSIRIFRGLEGLGELSYLAPLKPICGLAIAILELAQVSGLPAWHDNRLILIFISAVRQTLRKLRDDHTELIDRIERLALILDPVKHETGARVMIAEVGDLERWVRNMHMHVGCIDRAMMMGQSPAGDCQHTGKRMPARLVPTHVQDTGTQREHCIVHSKSKCLHRMLHSTYTESRPQ